MIDAILQSDQCSSTADNGAVITWKTTIANQSEYQFLGLNAINDELRTPSNQPGKKWCNQIGSIRRELRSE